MTLTIDEVTRIAEEAARAASPVLRLAGVTLGGAPDGGYVEVLVNITGCQAGACQVSVGVFRNVGEQALRQQITAKLRDHLESHA